MGAFVTGCFSGSLFEESFSNIVGGGLLAVSLHFDDNAISRLSSLHGPKPFEGEPCNLCVLFSARVLFCNSLLCFHWYHTNKSLGCMCIRETLSNASNFLFG